MNHVCFFFCFGKFKTSLRKKEAHIQCYSKQDSETEENLGDGKKTRIDTDLEKQDEDAKPSPECAQNISQKSGSEQVGQDVLQKNSLNCHGSSPGISSACKSEDPETEEEEEILSYEKMRLKNLQENAEFLASLGIEKAKENLKRKTTNSKESVHKKLKIYKKEVQTEPTRRSLRVRSIKPLNVIEVPYVENTYVEKLRHPPGPLVMTSCMYANVTEDMHNNLHFAITSACETSSQIRPLSSSLKSYMDEFKKIKLTREHIVKVVKERIFSLAIHPSEQKILVAAGDKWGNLGFWDVESTDGAVTAYFPHISPINQVQFCAWDPTKVYTSSYDGTLRCGDFEENIFKEIYSVPFEVDTLLYAFSFQSEQVLAVAQSDGCIAVVDQRTAGTSAEKMYHLHEKAIRGFDIHPVNKNYFVTGSTDGSLSVWDFRKLKPKSSVPIATLKHGRSVNSAYFSPITGNKVLSSSSDDTINIFNTTKMTEDIAWVHKIKHNNNVGRWLTKFRPVWHPSREDLFVTGSMNQPRRIEIFSDAGKLISNFFGDGLNSATSINVIHPHRNILAGGNSSGRVHVFM